MEARGEALFSSFRDFENQASHGNLNKEGEVMPEPSFVVNLNGDLLSRANLYKWIREFLRVNGMQESGYFMEFGILNGEGMIQAYRILRGIITTYFGFDSFAGLPKLSNQDLKSGLMTPMLYEGNFKGGIQETVRENILQCTGMEEKQLILTPGYFSDSLKQFNKDLLKGQGDLMVCYVDCDLYSSSKDVFEFIEPLAITGTWLLLDDYWLYRGHPDHGQRKAFDEWMHNSVRLGYTDYGNFNGYGKAVILYEK